MSYAHRLKVGKMWSVNVMPKLLGVLSAFAHRQLVSGVVYVRTHPMVTQVWRPLRGPVDDSPLGMVDAASVAKEDLLPYTLHFPGRTGYNYAAKYNPEHR